MFNACILPCTRNLPRLLQAIRISFYFCFNCCRRKYDLKNYGHLYGWPWLSELYICCMIVLSIVGIQIHLKIWPCPERVQNSWANPKLNTIENMSEIRNNWLTWVLERSGEIGRETVQPDLQWAWHVGNRGACQKCGKCVDGFQAWVSWMDGLETNLSRAWKPQKEV